MQKICVHNGRIWERAELHLKSAIPGFRRRNIVKRIELELLKQLVG